MTTDEFTGHLLAALHGPKKDEIVMRIVEVLFEGLDADSDRISMMLEPKIKEFVAMLSTTIRGDLPTITHALALIAMAEDEIRMAEIDPSFDGVDRSVRAVQRRRSALGVLGGTDLGQKIKARLFADDDPGKG